MRTYESAAASSNGEREYSINQLMEIDGIARKTAEAMFEIGVHSYADLAHYLSERTAQQVSVALKEHGVNRPPAFIDQATWVRQAREFDELENAASTQSEGETEPEEKPEEAPSRSPAPAEPSDIRIEIGDVQLSVIKPTIVRPEKMLKAEVSFQLYGSHAETLAAKGIPFRIEGYTVNLESGVSKLVTSVQSRLVPHLFEYAGEQAFDIPDVGRYEFHSIVLLLPPGKTATYHCGPTIRVVP
jgi:hypothetical protein